MGVLTFGPSYSTCQSSLVAQSEKNPSEMQETAWNAGEPGLIPGSQRSTEEGNGNPLQYSCLKNSMDRGTWWVTVYRVAKCWTWLKWLSTHRKNKSQLFWCLELNSSTFVKLSRHSAGEKGWTNKEKAGITYTSWDSSSQLVTNLFPLWTPWLL